MQMIELPDTKRDVTIMVIDDDDIDAKSIVRALHELKIANPVARARDGVEALEILEKADFNTQNFIILLDLNMPRMAGLEFLAHLRDSAQLRHLLVFVLTTSEAEADVAGAYQYNVAGYMVKHGGVADFMQLLSTLNNYWRIIELPQPCEA